MQRRSGRYGLPMPRGWKPEGTATYQEHLRGEAALASFVRVQTERQSCAWCWGQGYLVERSALGWMPVTCPICATHADDITA